MRIMYVYLYTYVQIHICKYTYMCVCRYDFLKHLKVNLEIFVSKYFSMFYLKKKKTFI